MLKLVGTLYFYGVFPHLLENQYKDQFKCPEISDEDESTCCEAILKF